MASVIVSGVGQVIGYGIVRALKLGNPRLRVIGTDIYPHAIGQTWCDRFVRCPLASDVSFPGFLQQLAKEEEAQCIFSGFPQEIPVLARLAGGILDQGTRVVLNTTNALLFGVDKWELATEISRSSLCIETRLLTAASKFSDIASLLGVPFIIKPRNGFASRGFATIANESDFERRAIKDGSFIAQRRVGCPEAEFTTAVYGDGEGGFAAAIAMRRVLGGEGNTVRAEVVLETDFDEAHTELCHLIKPVGPTNFQFRLDPSGEPRLLEINPRISSSTYMRALCGYNEALMAYAHFVENTLPHQPDVEMKRFVRFAEDREW